MQKNVLSCLLAASLGLEVGCGLLPRHGSPGRPSEIQASPVPPRSPHPPWIFPRFFSWKLPFFQHSPPPPRAQTLQKVGIIRTVSLDGSYVIIELEPGVMVPPGRKLVVTAPGGEIIQLKAAETEPPYTYFIADVENGRPSPGQIVQE